MIMRLEQLENEIFGIRTQADFERIALEVYRYQRVHVPVYKEYVDLLNRPEPTKLSEIPFLPIAFFKSHAVIAEGFQPELLFKSSGTTGMQRSQHPVAFASMYERSFFPTYEAFSGPVKDQVIVALLPNYVEQGNSSLVYMVEKLVAETEDVRSGFYLHETDQLTEIFQSVKASGKQLVVFGVSYALLDLAEKGIDLTGAITVETGGMKGRRKELSKEDLHDLLKTGLSVSYVSSEYGMCELLSQAYADKDGLFEVPNWMKILLRDVNDPFGYVSGGRSGGINVIDLANLYSCSFIATQDLGRFEGERFRLMGRFDHSDIRGCNLLVS
jgi:hypothetical protein